VKPVHFKVCKDTLTVRSQDVSDTFLSPRQIVRLLVTLVNVPLGPSERALILDKPAWSGLTAGLKRNSCSPEWQLPFLKDRGVGHREANAGLGRRQEVVVVGVKIDVRSKLSQPSPSRGRGETAPFIGEALEALRRHADGLTEAPTVTPIPPSEWG